jgi:hypothetical protein
MWIISPIGLEVNPSIRKCVAIHPWIGYIIDEACSFHECLTVNRSYIFYNYDIGLCSFVLVFDFLGIRLIMKI